MTGKKPSEMAPEELARHVVQQAFELNLHMRALSLMGYRIHADVVDRKNVAQPDGWPEFQVTARAPEEKE